MSDETRGLVVRHPADGWRSSSLPAAWTPSGERGAARLISVRPLGGGWCVQGDDLEPALFHRGGHAEHQARALAEAFARLGRDARVAVYDRGQRLAGAIHYFGGTAPPPTPARAYPWSH